LIEGVKEAFLSEYIFGGGRILEAFSHGTALGRYLICAHTQL